MKSYSIVSLAFSAATTVSAHFNLNFPAARGFNEHKLGTFPCGSMDTVSKTRTPWPLNNGEIALTMGHSDAQVQVLIGMGNNPGSAFNTVIKPTFKERGLGAFCIEGIIIPGSLKVVDGLNATLQVITNGEDGGGLYNCADITFSATAKQPSASICKNNTGVTTSPAGTYKSPNLTSISTTSTSNGSSSGNKGSGSGTSGASASISRNWAGLSVVGAFVGFSGLLVW